MKSQVIDVLFFGIILFISMILMVNNFNQPSKITLPNIELNEMTTCLDVTNCINNTRSVYESQKEFNPIKEIKNFIRKKMYV